MMTHKDDGDISESWQQPGNLEDVWKIIEGWSPEIVAAAQKMKNVSIGRYAIAIL
jgi:hypothetical protein